MTNLLSIFQNEDISACRPERAHTQSEEACRRMPPKPSFQRLAPEHHHKRPDVCTESGRQNRNFSVSVPPRAPVTAVRMDRYSMRRIRTSPGRLVIRAVMMMRRRCAGSKSKRCAKPQHDAETKHTDSLFGTLLRPPKRGRRPKAPFGAVFQNHIAAMHAGHASRDGKPESGSSGTAVA